MPIFQGTLIKKINLIPRIIIDKAKFFLFIIGMVFLAIPIITIVFLIIPIMLIGFSITPPFSYVIWGPRTYARQLARLADDPRARRDMGDSGRRFAAAWTWDACVRRWRELLTPLRA